MKGTEVDTGKVQRRLTALRRMLDVGQGGTVSPHDSGAPCRIRDERTSTRRTLFFQPAVHDGRVEAGSGERGRGADQPLASRVFAERMIHRLAPERVSDCETRDRERGERHDPDALHIESVEDRLADRHWNLRKRKESNRFQYRFNPIFPR